jgi:hypothetical protein
MGRNVMTGTRVLGTVPGVLATLVMAGSLVAPARSVSADVAAGVEEPLTRFEKFVLEACSPCVKESSPIATLPVPPVKTAVWARTMAGRMARTGEVGVEALRSSLLGRPSRQLLAVRLTLSVAAGNPIEMYRMATGVVDEEELAAFVSGLDDLAQAAAAPTPPDGGADFVEIDVRSGSVRVGVIRQKGEALAYVQAGDIRVLARRPVWEAPSTFYLPVADLAALRSAVVQAAAKLSRMRSGQ